MSMVITKTIIFVIYCHPYSLKIILFLLSVRESQKLRMSKKYLICSYYLSILSGHIYSLNIITYYFYYLCTIHRPD